MSAKGASVCMGVRARQVGTHPGKPRYLPLLFVGTVAAVGCNSPVPATTNPTANVATPVASVIVRIPVGAAAMGASAYGTNPLVVKQSTLVTWINDDTMDHTVTGPSGMWDSGAIKHGAAFSRVFDALGTFNYSCAIHGAQAMSGAVQVNP